MCEAPPQPDSLVSVTWVDSGEVVRPCPVCGLDGEKPAVLKLEWGFSGDAICRADYVCCPECASLFHAEPVHLDYEGEGSCYGYYFEFYLEQGASIDGMLRNLYLVPVTGNRYLEVGPGFGFSLDFAHLTLGYECVGMDPSPLAQEGAALLGVDIRPRYFTSAQDVPGRFDLIGCSEVIEHIPEPVPFVEALAGTLTAEGAVWFTTPNAALVAKDANRSRLGSLVHGWHPVLFTAKSLELVLRRGGFAHVEVWESDASLYAVASHVPKEVDRDAGLDRRAYCSYLRSRWELLDKSTPAGCGIGVRLFKELVNLGDYDRTLEVLTELEEGLEKRFGIDLNEPLTLPLGDSFTSLGHKVPYNITVLLFHKGIWALNHLRQIEQAERCFSGAFRAGSKLLEFLLAVGGVDQETDHLTREALKHSVMCLNQMDPQRRLEGIGYLKSLGSILQDDLDPLLNESVVQLEVPRVIDLVMAGSYAEVQEIVNVWGAELEPGAVAVAGIDDMLKINYLFARGIWTLNHLGQYPEAAQLFDSAFGLANSRYRAAPDEQVGNLAWQALFHRGLAHKLAGDRRQAEQAANALHVPGRGVGAGLPPADGSLRRRIGELL